MFLEISDELVNLNTITKIKRKKSIDKYLICFYAGLFEIKTISFEKEEDMDAMYNRLKEYLSIDNTVHEIKKRTSKFF
jgi:hypothetical protein